MTDPAKCERCGQVDCPTLTPHRSDNPNGLAFAFASCAIMRYVLARCGTCL